MTLSSIINILETIFSNDSDIDGSYETSSTIPVAWSFLLAKVYD